MLAAVAAASALDVQVNFMSQQPFKVHTPDAHSTEEGKGERSLSDLGNWFLRPPKSVY